MPEAGHDAFNNEVIGELIELQGSFLISTLLLIVILGPMLERITIKIMIKNEKRGL